VALSDCNNLPLSLLPPTLLDVNDTSSCANASSAAGVNSGCSTTVTTVSTAIHIRKSVLEYQSHLRQQQQHPTSSLPSHPARLPSTPRIFGNRSTTVTTDHHHGGDNIVVVGTEFELCQYYTSFLGHDVAILWAQLMAIGDHAYSVASSHHGK
jgi:hypothetical protein